MLKTLLRIVLVYPRLQDEVSSSKFCFGLKSSRLCSDRFGVFKAFGQGEGLETLCRLGELLNRMFRSVLGAFDAQDEVECSKPC